MHFFHWPTPLSILCICYLLLFNNYARQSIKYTVATAFVLTVNHSGTLESQGGTSSYTVSLCRLVLFPHHQYLLFRVWRIQGVRRLGSRGNMEVWRTLWRPRYSMQTLSRPGKDDSSVTQQIFIFCLSNTSNTPAAIFTQSMFDIFLTLWYFNISLETCHLDQMMFKQKQHLPAVGLKENKYFLPMPPPPCGEAP